MARILQPVVLVALVGAPAAWGDTLLVPSQYPTIQEAIDAAKHGDTILVADGVYAGATFWGKAVTVRSENGPGACVVQPPGTGFIFKTKEGPDSVLEGFTIRNFLASGSVGGAGVLVDGAGPTIRDCIFVMNTGTERGGGAAVRNGSPRFEGCRFEGNRAGTFGVASGEGGAVYVSGGSAAFERCVFAANRTEDGIASTFGPIYVDGGHGGAVWAVGAVLRFDACSFLQNRAGRGGDGDSFPCFSAPLHGTDGGSGGALYLTDCETTLVNCLLAGNTAGEGGNGGLCSPPSNGGNGGDGGAVMAMGGTLELIHCTLVGNSAGIGGAPGGASASAGVGGVGGGVVASGAVVIANSILWGNTAPEMSGEPAQITATGPSPVVSYTCVEGLTGALGGPGNIDADPRFVNAAAGDYRLDADSACIDAADNGAVPVGVFTDLAGNGRFAEGPGPNTGVGPAPIADLGCLEASSEPFCFANCDGSTTKPVLNLNDFICFANLFSIGHPLANCDGSTATPLVNINDLICFQARFTEGCE